MRKLSYKLSVKIISVFISVITFLLLFALVVGIIFMSELGVYTNPFETVKTSFFDFCSLVAHDYYDDSHTIVNYYTNGILEEYDKRFDNLYTIAIDDHVLVSTYNDEENYTPYTTSISYYDDSTGTYLFDYDITVYYPVKAPVSVEFIETVYNMRYTLILFAFILALIYAVSLTVLFCGSGHRDTSDAITLRSYDKIPFDIQTAIVLFIAFLQFEALWSISYYAPVTVILIVCVFILDYLLVLNYFISFAILAKAKALIKRSFIYIIITYICLILKKLFKGLFVVVLQLPLIWKTILALLIWTGLEFLFISFTYYNIDTMLTAWLLSKLILFPVIIGIALLLRKIQKAGIKISEGDLEYRVDTSHMIGDFKEFGDNLNHISEGIGKAVEDKLKSERFKTELITNVSHDIKTPLTSIINYVDLIKKEQPENENVKEYITVLDRQSSRLKKLIEDLIEASKASTGNLKVDLVPCELNVLLTQIAGEYEEMMEKQALSLVLDCPKQSIIIMADSRHLWRVIDNLMNNIRKYSMRGTRVYINLAADESKAYLTFRNISSSPLNISSNELMERFTRGDSSRNTEGSGLGLSISKNLTELQGGVFALAIDGDLFKASLIFDLINQL